MRGLIVSYSTASYLLFRSIVKWFLYKMTRLCELQRICYGAIEGYPRSAGVEKSLRLSRSPVIKDVIKSLDTVPHSNVIVLTDNVMDAVDIIIRVKRINRRLHPLMERLMHSAMMHIWGYQYVFAIVERTRCIAYDSDNIDHEHRLLHLWNVLMPDEQLEQRVTKQWQTIGFQGDDPKTDFRGMGMLGLENLNYFAETYTMNARRVLSHSHHPVYGYTFAVVGINLTSLAYQLFKTHDAKTYYYNTTKSVPHLNQFHELYCYLFTSFDAFWMLCKPTSIMDYSAIYKRFEADIKKKLRKETARFVMSPHVMTI